MHLDHGFSLGSHDVHPGDGCVVVAGATRRVDPKAMAVLLELARLAPHACSRSQIEHAVWPRGYVTEDALTRCIGLLRRTFDADGAGMTVIETVPRRGYRLCIAPGPLHAPAPAPPPPPHSPDAAPTIVIVMPWRAAGGTQAALVADRLGALLAARLAQSSRLTLISSATAARLTAQRASVARIATVTGAAWVVCGSVLGSDDRVQVVAELVDAGRDVQVWTADRVRPLSELLPLLHELADDLAAKLGARLGQRTPLLTAPKPTCGLPSSPDPALRWHG